MAKLVSVSVDAISLNLLAPCVCFLYPQFAGDELGKKCVAQTAACVKANCLTIFTNETIFGV